MDQISILPDYYRMRFNEAVRGMLELSADQIRNDGGEDLIFSDVLTLRNLNAIKVPIGDPGELKHAPFDVKSLGTAAENSMNVRRLDPTAATMQAGYAYQYRVNSTLDTAQVRKKMEDRVRRCKLSGLACPYKDEKGQCGALFIRCGDRMQFSLRETGNERSFFHQCTYDWRRRGDYVLIVDDNRAMLDFCKSSFALFLQYDETKIITAESVGQAIDLLARSKVAGTKISLVITDIVMPGKSGYDLVNELYDRNFQVEIVLMREEHERQPEPPEYKGAVEILPNRPFVSGILLKPFHSEKLIVEVKNLRFGGER